MLGKIAIDFGAATSKNDSEDQPSPYLKLNADCWEHIFDYLSFDDILTMGKTCKRMNQMAGYYMREYHPQYRFKLINGEIFGEDVRLRINFYPFIHRLNARWNNEKNITKFLSNANSFDALKMIEFSNGHPTEAQVEQMQHALKNVEHILIHEYEADDNIFEKFANHCPKLKRIDVKVLMPQNTLFFSQYYPALECCRYVSWNGMPIGHLKMFFENHSKLNQLHVSSEFMWINQDAFMQSNITFDLLVVNFITSTKVTFNEFAEFLKKFHDRNGYKTLFLKLGTNLNGQISDAIYSLPQLRMLNIVNNSYLDLDRFASLRRLQIYAFVSRTDIKVLAKGLTELEQLLVPIAEIKTILPFIRYSHKLNLIQIGYLDDDVGLDLSALNKERKKLQNACQLSILLNDDAYLYHKWKSHNFKLELDLIKIIRYHEFDGELA